MLLPLNGVDGPVNAVDSSALRLAALVESSDDAIISEDLTGMVETWNRAAERMFGYTAAELIGRSSQVIVPSDRVDEDRAVRARIESGETVRHFETVRLTKHHTLVPVSMSVSPLLDGGGELIGLSRIARDITQQKALERQAFRLAAIVNSSDDAIVSKDLNGVILTWNPAAERMFGYTADEAVGRSIRMIIPADRQAEEDYVLGRIRSGLAIEHFETVRQRKDGSTLDISLSTSPIRDRSGKVIGASKIARDISPQRRLMRELEEANRTKDEFLATLSHELRTPLNAVIGYLRIVRTGHVTEARREQILEVLERNATILSQLVSDLLDISSIVTGKVRLHTATVDLAEIVSAAIDVVRPTAEAKGIELSLTTSSQPLVTRADAERLQQVFWNLLTNALKFTRSGGRVAVDVSRHGSTAQVTVVDTGVGIKADFLPYVFQRFRQADSVFGREVGGLGLGLALVRHFVELHGGDVSAESAGEGKGATFRVRLPLTSS